jgi:uncharacterized protein (DUF4415 family)
MSEEPPKRLSLAEKRAMARPLLLQDPVALEEDALEDAVDGGWTDVVMTEQGRKKLISLRVDPEVLEFFKSHGPGYQTRINAVLRAYMQVKKEVSQGGSAQP